MVAALEQLNGGTGSQVAAADADDDKYVAVGTDTVGGLLDAVHLRGLLSGGQVQPAMEIAASAGVIGQGCVGSGDLFLGGQQVRQGQLTPDIGNINFDHCSGSSFLLVLKEALIKKSRRHKILASNCRLGAKDSPLGRRRFIQRFLKCLRLYVTAKSPQTQEEEAKFQNISKFRLLPLWYFGALSCIMERKKI